MSKQKPDYKKDYMAWAQKYILNKELDSGAYGIEFTPYSNKLKTIMIMSENKQPMMVPFSSATSFLIWQERNCYKCSLYENTSTDENKAGCKLAFNLDLSAASSGEIPVSIAEQIGFNDTVLSPVCKMRT